MTKPTCTCHPVPEQYHTTHYGAAEPGSTLEPDYGCAVHFPKVKREWGKAPATIQRSVFGSTEWAWRCLVGQHAPAHDFTGHGREVTHGAALTALAEHQKAEHVDAMFRGDRGGPLGMAMDRTSERSGA